MNGSKKSYRRLDDAESDAFPPLNHEKKPPAAARRPEAVRSRVQLLQPPQQLGGRRPLLHI